MPLRDIFKREEGGSALGNLIRGVGDKFTGGMVSKILKPSTAEQVAKQEAKWSEKGKKYTPSPTKTVENPLPNGTAGMNENQDINGGNPKVMDTKKVGIIVGVLLGIGALVFAVVKLVKRKK